MERGSMRRRRWWLLLLLGVLVLLGAILLWPRNHTIGEAVHYAGYTITVLDSHTTRTVYYDVVTNGVTSRVESPGMNVQVDVREVQDGVGVIDMVSFYPFLPATWFIVDGGQEYAPSSQGNGVLTFDSVPTTDTLTLGLHWTDGQTTLWTLNYAHS